MFSSPWTLWFAALALPGCGYGFGYLLAWLLRQKPKQCRTISFETGAQNVAIALSLIAVTFDGTTLFNDLFTFPSIFGFALIIEALALVVIYKLYFKHCGEEYGEQEDDYEEANKEDDSDGEDEKRKFKKLESNEPI